MRWRNVLFGLAILLLVVGAVVVNQSKEEETAGVKRQEAVGPIQPDRDVKPQEGFAAPDFELETLSGETVRLYENNGKPSLINFWASWCKPCEQEAAALEEAWKFYQPTGKVVFLGVDYVDTEPEARIFLKKFGNTYPNGPDMVGRVSQMFRIQGVPETFILDTNGILKYVKIGPYLSVNEIREVVDPLLP